MARINDSEQDVILVFKLYHTVLPPHKAQSSLDFSLVFVIFMMLMKEKFDITTLLKQSYFWDIDFTSGKAVSKRLIVERIFSLGTLAEMTLLINYYGKGEVEKILIELNYIDPKTLNFASKYFGRSKKTFKCYTRKQLMPQYWNS